MRRRSAFPGSTAASARATPSHSAISRSASWRRPATPSGTSRIGSRSARVVFVGDTLFAMGAGRIFEGNAEMMWNSLKKIMALPPDTEIYCGHEYTAANARFALTVDPENAALQTRAKEVDRLRAGGKPTLPTRLDHELETNPFLGRMSPRFGRNWAAVRARLEGFRRDPRTQEQSLMPDPQLSADDVIALLGLKPHPEGGHFRETFPRRARRRARRLDRHLLPARRGRGLALAPRRCRGGVALVRRRPARAVTRPRRRSAYFRPARARSAIGRAAAGCRAGARVAARAEPRRLDARRLHGRARLRVRGL